MEQTVVGCLLVRVEKLERDFAVYRRGMTRHLTAILQALLEPGSNPEVLARLLAKSGGAGGDDTGREVKDLVRVVQKLWKRMGDAEAALGRHRAANARSFGVLLEQVTRFGDGLVTTCDTDFPACRMADLATHDPEEVAP